MLLVARSETHQPRIVSCKCNHRLPWVSADSASCSIRNVFAASKSLLLIFRSEHIENFLWSADVDVLVPDTGNLFRSLNVGRLTLCDCNLALLFYDQRTFYNQKIEQCSFALSI